METDLNISAEITVSNKYTQLTSIKRCISMIRLTGQSGRKNEDNNHYIVICFYHGNSRWHYSINSLGHDYDAVKERKMIGAFGTGFLLGTLCGIFFVSMGQSAKRRDSIEN